MSENSEMLETFLIVVALAGMAPLLSHAACLPPLAFTHESALDGDGRFHVLWKPLPDKLVMEMQVCRCLLQLREMS